MAGSSPAMTGKPAHATTGRKRSHALPLPFPRASGQIASPMQAGQQVHGSCVSRDGDGVLLIGPPGSGKSDLALRLLGRGFSLVADDRVDIADGIAAPPAALAGLLEVRGLGIVRLPYAATRPPRLGRRTRRRGGTAAGAGRHAGLGLPLIRLDPAAASAPDRDRAGARLRARPRQPGRRSLRRMNDAPKPPEAAARRAGHRPVRRRQGLDPARAGGYRLRGGGQSAA